MKLPQYMDPAGLILYNDVLVYLIPVLYNI